MTLIVGRDSKIGGALLKLYDPATAIGTTRRAAGGHNHLDLLAPGISPVVDNQVQAGSVVYLMAGITSLKECRESPALAELINVTRTVELAQHYANRGCHIVFPSTSRVFSGVKPYAKAHDLHDPRTIYGMLKSKTERLLLKLPSVTIIRLSAVMAPTSPLIAKWADELRNARTIHPYRNAYAAPISLDLAVQAVAALGDGRHHGIFQLSADRAFSYDGLAFTIAVRVGANAERQVQSVRGTGDEHYPWNTTLDVTELTAAIGIKAPGPYAFLGTEKLWSAPAQAKVG